MVRVYILTNKNEITISYSSSNIKSKKAVITGMNIIFPQGKPEIWIKMSDNMLAKTINASYCNKILGTYNQIFFSSHSHNIQSGLGATPTRNLFLIIMKTPILFPSCRSTFLELFLAAQRSKKKE